MSVRDRSASIRPRPARPRRPAHRRPRVWPRALRRLGRRFRTAAVVLAFGVAVTTTMSTGEHGSEGFAGPARVVLVATRDLPIGTVLAAGDLERRSLPEDAVPAAAVATATSPEALLGRTVVAPIVIGEALVVARLAPEGLHGLAARVPAHRAALAIPIDERTPPLDVGQQVDLYTGADDPGTGNPSASGASAAHLVSRGDLVVDVNDHTATIAVDPDDTAAVASALAAGTVIVAIAGP